jgi:hypothetical protein
VVTQYYESEAENEYVIRGNAAIMKCKIPSFVADFVILESWIDSEGHEYQPNQDEFGITLSLLVTTLLIPLPFQNLS